MYYVRIRGKVFGPLDEKQIVDMVRQGKLGRMNEISTDNRQWVRADEFEQFFPKVKSKRRQVFHPFELPTGDASSDTPPSHAAGTPGAPPNENASTVPWYYSDDGKTGTGPFPHHEIVQMIRQGQIVGKTILWRDDLDPQTAETLPDFASFFQKADKTSLRKNRKNQSFQPSQHDAAVRAGQVSSETLEQFEKASTWAFALALFGTIGAALSLISQLFQFVLITQSDSVYLTLGFLLGAAVFDATVGYMLFTFWRYVNEMKRTAHHGDEISLAQAARRMAEFWRACVISPIVFFVFLLLVTLLAFAVGINSVLAPIREFPLDWPMEWPGEISPDRSGNAPTPQDPSTVSFPTME